MPNLKVKKGNDILTFGLTDNLRDVGEKRLPIVIEGKTYYARLGGDKTALVVQRTSNSAKSYVQTNPVLFNTWRWGKVPYDIRGTEKIVCVLTEKAGIEQLYMVDMTKLMNLLQLHRRILRLMFPQQVEIII